MGSYRHARWQRRRRAQLSQGALYDHAPFLVPAARAAGTAFAIEGIGDVQLAWENEALREVAESKGDLEIVYPPVSILAEPAVTWSVSQRINTSFVERDNWTQRPQNRRLTRRTNGFSKDLTWFEKQRWACGLRCRFPNPRTALARLAAGVP